MTSTEHRPPEASSPTDLEAERTARAQELVAVLGVDVPGALGAAAAIGLADALASGPVDYAELAIRLDVNEDALRRLCRYLVSIGLLEPTGSESIGLTDVGHILRSDDPRGVHWRARNVHLSQAVLVLEHSIRTGRPAYDEVFGEGVWSRLAHHEADRDAFDRLMATLAANLSVPAALLWDWPASSHVVDVGGGVGVVLAALLGRHPHLRGTLVDGPRSIAEARRRLAGAGLSERAELLAGDMFTVELPAADTFLLSRVVHDFDDEPVSVVLGSVRRSIDPGGHLLVVDGVVPDEPLPHPMLSSDLRMLAYQAGRERTWSQFEALFAASGFELRERRHTDAPIELLVAVPV